MTQRMTCHDYEALLARDLEGDLSREDQERADAHLLDCLACSALRAELADIAAAARALPVMSPSRDLWDGIASRIDAPVTDIGSVGELAPARGRTFRFAAAAAALVAVTAGTTYVMTRAAYNDGQPQVATGVSPILGPAMGDPARPVLVSDTRLSSDAAFDREVVQLRGLLEQRRPDLDSATVALLERNLQIIDRAIAESRAALAKDPGSALLNRQLHNALGKKVQVLRSAALLPTEAG